MVRGQVMTLTNHYCFLMTVPPTDDSGFAAAFGRSGQGPGLWIVEAQTRPFLVVRGFDSTRKPAAPWPAELLGTLLIASEYLVPFAEQNDAPYDPQAWISYLLLMFSRVDMLAALSALNHISDQADLMEELRQRAVARWTRPLAEALNRALPGDGRGPGRLLLARPPILRAMRLVAQFSPADEATRLRIVRERGGDGTQFDPLDAAMLLSHAVAEGLASILHGCDVLA